jgi:hypothetical protein
MALRKSTFEEAEWVANVAATRSGTIVPLNFSVLSSFVRALATADTESSRPFSLAFEFKRRDAPSQVQ